MYWYNSKLLRGVNAMIWYDDTGRLQADADICRFMPAQCRLKLYSCLSPDLIQLSCSSCLQPTSTHSHHCSLQIPFTSTLELCCIRHLLKLIRLFQLVPECQTILVLLQWEMVEMATEITGTLNKSSAPRLSQITIISIQALRFYRPDVLLSPKERQRTES